MPCSPQTLLSSETSHRSIANGFLNLRSRVYWSVPKRCLLVSAQSFCLKLQVSWDVLPYGLVYAMTHRIGDDTYFLLCHWLCDPHPFFPVFLSSRTQAVYMILDSDPSWKVFGVSSRLLFTVIISDYQRPLASVLAWCCDQEVWCQFVIFMVLGSYEYLFCVNEYGDFSVKYTNGKVFCVISYHSCKYSVLLFICLCIVYCYLLFNC